MYTKEDLGISMLMGFRLGISFGIESLKRYAEEMETFLNKKLKQLESCDASKISDFEQYHEDFIELKDEFPFIFRSSLFLTCYSFFEFEFSIINRTFCKHYPIEPIFNRYKNNKYKEKKINKGKISSLEISMDYLEDVYKLNFKANSKYFNNIVIYNKLRNNISHNAGRLVQNYDEITNFINNNKSKITVNDYSLIIFTKEFALDVIDVVNSFFEEFFGELATWIQSQEK
jgi:hypothetical protein